MPEIFNPETFNPVAITDVQTPALLLDPERMMRNIERMHAKMSGFGVCFRPHVKTAKSTEIIRRIVGSDVGPVTVSTLHEAEQLAVEGFTDILYAVGLTPNKVARVLRLREQGVDLKVIIDNAEAASVIGKVAEQPRDPIPVLIEIDSDGHRAGVRPDNPEELLRVAANLTGCVRPAGVMTHAGGSYSSRSTEEIAAYAQRERDAVVEAARILRGAGYDVEHVSLGSTPTALFAQDLSGVTEVRAGVFVFFDLVMAGLGVCDVDDIALSVLASVNAVQRDRGRVLVDAGWAAVSRDQGTAAQRVNQYYGLVCDASGTPYPDLVMLEANQEHGVIGLRPGSAAALPDLHVGDLLRILPNHACATAGQHKSYLVVDGAQAVGEWSRWGGW